MQVLDSYISITDVTEMRSDYNLVSKLPRPIYLTPELGHIDLVQKHVFPQIITRI